MGSPGSEPLGHCWFRRKKRRRRRRRRHSPACDFLWPSPFHPIASCHSQAHSHQTLHHAYSISFGSSLPPLKKRNPRTIPTVFCFSPFHPNPGCLTPPTLGVPPSPGPVPLSAEAPIPGPLLRAPVSCMGTSVLSLEPSVCYLGRGPWREAPPQPRVRAGGSSRDVLGQQWLVTVVCVLYISLCVSFSLPLE